jgi:serine/threonine-protein kinase
MSTVYLASDETLDRSVAIKLLHAEISDQPDQLERFRREATSAARLSHPNLVAVIDAGEDGGRPYIVFEYVEGKTLKQRIQEEGGLPVDEAVAYAIEIGRGLSAAHARKLIHRDVKPQNVLIDPDGRAKVTDFGIARSLEAHGLTATGRVLGTTDYVSPEQAMGVEVDERCDVYSLGVVLYEMLSGDVPYEAETQVGVAMKHVNEPMPDIFELRPDVSAAVAAVVDRATAKDPRDRYDSAAAMVRDLEATLEVEAARGGGTTGEATTVLRSVPRSRRRLAGPSRMSRAGVAMGALGLGLIGVALLLGSGELDKLGTGGEGGSEIELARDAAADFDPISGGGDGTEHSAEVERVVDGDPAGTAWASETYGLEDFGNKEGVGITIDAGGQVEVSEIELRMAVAGADVEIYSAPGEAAAPEDLEGWGAPIASAQDIGTRERIQVEAGAPSQQFLIWITKLPAADDGSGFRAEIADIRLLE